MKTSSVTRSRRLVGAAAAAGINALAPLMAGAGPAAAASTTFHNPQRITTPPVGTA